MRIWSFVFCVLSLGGCTLMLGVDGYRKGEGRAPDAAADGAAILDGNTPIDVLVDGSSPGFLCGGSSVCSLGQACCNPLPPPAGSWSSSTCNTDSLTCQSKGGVALTCDDSSDCASGQVCCLALTSGYPTGSTCESDCAAGSAWLCTSDKKCPTSRPACRARSYPSDLGWLLVCE
jgi:hypothetical protein